MAAGQEDASKLDRTPPRLHTGLRKTTQREKSPVSEKILIAYATKSGSTEEVAEAIAKTFEEEGTPTEVKPAWDAPDPAEYRAVVVGSPLYSGKLLSDAAIFINRHKEKLVEMPTALFIVCLVMSRPTERSVQKVIRQTRPMVELLRPRDVGLFAGSLHYKDVGFFNRILLRLMKVPEGDFRNWDTIHRWAREVHAKLTGQKPK